MAMHQLIVEDVLEMVNVYVVNVNVIQVSLEQNVILVHVDTIQALTQDVTNVNQSLEVIDVRDVLMDTGLHLFVLSNVDVEVITSMIHVFVVNMENVMVELVYLEHVLVTVDGMELTAINVQKISLVRTVIPV